MVLAPNVMEPKKGTRGVLPLETLTPRRTRYLLSVGRLFTWRYARASLNHAAPTGGVLFGGDLLGTTPTVD